MTRTHFHDDLLRIVPGRAYSYESTGSGFQNAPLNYANAGATSLFTTAPDLVKWLDNFRDPKVGGPKAIARMQEQAVLTDGSKVPYALGLSIGEFRDLRTVSHNGGDAGFRSQVIWFPDQNFGVAVLSNLGSFNPGAIANRVVAVYLESQMKAVPPKAEPAPRRTFITLPPAETRRFTGAYFLNDDRVEVTQKEGKLFAARGGSNPMELRPLSSNRFFLEQLMREVEFVPKPANGMGMKLTGNGGPALEGERRSEAPPAPIELNDYTGRYWSDEVETQYTIVLNNGKLTAVHPHHGEIALQSVSKDEFRSSAWFMPNVSFVRDDTGAVTAVILGGNRLTGVKFYRR